MHSIHGYILRITAVCNMLVMYHMKFTAMRRFYMNTTRILMPIIFLRYIATKDSQRIAYVNSNDARVYTNGCLCKIIS